MICTFYWLLYILPKGLLLVQVLPRDQTWSGADKGDAASPSQAEQVLGLSLTKVAKALCLMFPPQGQVSICPECGS